MTEQIADDDDWLIEDEVEAVAPVGPVPFDQRLWRVLIVDDDVDVHAVTRLALRNVSFKGRELELFSAYSGDEGFQMLRDTPYIALVLLDVVMETDDAGLLLAKRIRGELDNQLVRVVLRTGQPGQAPEQRVIIEYDINDYKAKTELTTQKLFTTVIASLRGYESLLLIERSRVGLGRILEGATNLYKIHSLREFASGVLNQVSAILDVGADGVLCVLQSNAPQSGGIADKSSPTVVAATGCYSELADSESLPNGHQLEPALARAFREKRSQYEHPENVMFIKTQQGHEFAISVTPPWPLVGIQRDLLEVFCHRIAAAFDNLYLFDQLHRAQEATVVALADLAEFRDEGAGEHVRRVQTMTNAIAKKLHESKIYPEEMTHELLDMIGVASILHDVGKVSTPDHILLKPGPHTAEEREIMLKHAHAGEAILDRAAKMVGGVSYLSMGAEIASCHHEHFDGGGYPHKLKGLDIPLSARIVGAVDVFDALLHRRPHKEAWLLKDVVEYMKQRRGTQFDPEIVDVLLEIVANEPMEWMLKDD